MKTNSRIVMKSTQAALAVMFGLALLPAHAGLTDIAAAPLANSSTSVVKPNMLFILDDSGSMGGDIMPDYVTSNFCKNNANATTTLDNCQFGDISYNSPDFNFVYYNPDINYKPAVNADGTSKQSYNTNALWQAVPNDAYNVQFTGTVNLLSAYPDYVWCNTGSPSTTDRTPPFSSGKCKREISGGTLTNGTLSGGTWTYPDGSFDDRNSVVSGAADPNRLNPYYYRYASVTWCSTRDNLGFGNGTCQLKKTSTFQYPKYGAVTRTDIVSGNSYPRSASRSDCTGAVGATGCSYTEEMTNFSNWYAYYRTRMMMMKTSAGLAFKTIDDRYRVGFITINPTCQNQNNGSCGSNVRSEKYLKIAPFDATQKSNWYTKFYAQYPDPSTPLREALSRAGRHYAGKTDGINAGMNDDPVEYSCQQNFTLLTTDGFWNGNGGKELDGTTDMRNYDASLVTTPRPLFDGSTLTTAVTTTPTLTQVVCSANASVFSGGSTCGCAANFKRVKQQTVTATSTVVSRDGVTQSTTPGSSTTYQDITACNATVVTTVTPTTIIEDQVVSGSAMTTFGAVNSVTTGSNQAGSCAANFARIKRRTTTYDKTVVTTDGTTTSNTNLNTAYTFSDTGSCTALTHTVTTQITLVEQQVLLGNNASTFTPVNGVAFTNTASGCSTSGAGQARLRQRTTVYNSTVVTTGGSAAAAVISGQTYSVSNGSCVNLTSTTTTSVTETSQWVGGKTSGASDPTAFGTSANGDNFNINYTCNTTGFTTKFQRVVVYNKFVTQVGSGGATTTFSGNNSENITVVGTACSLNLPAKVAAATTTVNGGSGTVVTGAPTAAGPSTTPVITVDTSTGQPAISLTPNPKTTTGTPVPSSTGATITASNFTISGGGPVSSSSTATSSEVGFANTLADVAEFYYATDLRPDGSLGTAVSGVQLDVGTDNNVPGQASTDPQKDSAVHQHMTTFTLGLGLDGQLNFAQDYKENPTGDFLAIKNGSKVWPEPVGDTETAIDDLWHAAVNGRGKYFSAKSPQLLASGLADALAGVNAVVGSAAAAATSNLEPVAGDNFAYIASYETVRWNGEIEARTINLTDGSIGDTAIWSAQSQLDTLTYATTPGGTSRNIKRFNSSASNKLEDFTWTNLSATEKTWFQSPFISGGGTGPALTQWSSLDATTQQPLAQGTNLLSFLRGDATFEDQATNLVAVNRVFRDRQHVLGDVVNAQPVYVKQISVAYSDAGFATFKNCVNAGGSGCSTVFNGPRAASVYIAANDGMLHALNGDTGAERWAYVPNIVLPKLYRLADKDYGNRHLFYVDGSPTVADIYDTGASKWRTILVAGLNSGGRGFYALDVTDPANPIGLWEFNVRATASCPSATILNVDNTDCDLGLSYGNPIITKLGNGQWVVMVTSGYNNVSPGDGKGYLYVLDPLTGVVKKKIQAANTSQALNPGDTTTPDGLAKINSWVDDSNANNTTLRVYGGDLLGNVWRFETDTGTAYAIAKLKDPSNVAQPVTTKPELGEATNGKAMIYIATGSYLGTSDLTSTQVQTIYGIRDDTNATTPASPINMRGTTVVAQTLVNTVSDTGAAIRTVTANPVDLTVKDGWRVDLPTSGERVNVDPKLQLGTLIVGSNVPANNACVPGGFSFLNFLDYQTGSYIPSSNGSYAGIKVGNSLVVGISVVRLPNDKTVAIVTTSDNKHPTAEPPFAAENPTGRRSSWRELTD